MQCGCFRWPVAASTSFEFYNSVAGPVVAKAGTLTIKMSKIPVVGVAPLAARSSTNRITFCFVLTSPICRLKFSILHMLDWGKVESFLGWNLTRAQMRTHTESNSCIDSAELLQPRFGKPLKNLLISIHLRKSFLTLNGLKDVSESWAYVQVFLGVMMLSLYRIGMHNLLISVGTSPSVPCQNFSSAARYFVSWQTKIILKWNNTK